MKQIDAFIQHANSGVKVEIMCPYCSAVQLAILRTSSGPQLKLCDAIDVAGCDKYFIVDIVEVKVNVEYYTLGKQNDR